MPKYRVKQGKKFGPGGHYTAGTILELSEKEATPFLDILEPAADTALVGSTQAVVPHEEPQFPNEAGVEIPDDLKIMPGTLNDDELDDSSGESENEQPAANPKTTRKPGSKPTRKRSHEE